MLLPRSFPELPKTRIFGVSTASREVGGDYFDVIPVEGHGVLVAIADVMGKGMPAALLATIFRAAIRARLHLAPMPGFLLTETNRQTQDRPRPVGYVHHRAGGVFFLSRQHLATATAGHCPILKYLARQQGTHPDRRGRRAPGRARRGDRITPPRRIARPGSRFLFLTDGLYEVQSLQGEMLGIEGFQKQILQFASSSPSVLCARLLEFVRAYSGEAQATDDRTLVVVERF